MKDDQIAEFEKTVKDLNGQVSQLNEQIDKLNRADRDRKDSDSAAAKQERKDADKERKQEKNEAKKDRKFDDATQKLIDTLKNQANEGAIAIKSLKTCQESLDASKNLPVTNNPVLSPENNKNAKAAAQDLIKPDLKSAPAGKASP